MSRGRVVGIDLGARRIGVAVSDSSGTLASPRATIERSGDPHQDWRAILAIVQQLGARRVVVGMPLSLDGRRGPAARRAEHEAVALAEALGHHGIELETFDERYTTVSAERQLSQAGRRPSARRRVVDQVAATVLLQAWLDGRHTGSGT